MRAPFILWTIVLLIGAPPAAHTQRQDSLSRVGAALARLRHGNSIRLHTQAQGWVEGIVDSSSDSLVILRSGQTRSAFAGTRADSLFIRRSNAGKGALIGAAVLAIPGAILGRLGASVANGSVAPAGGAVLGALAGAGVGALLGAAIGSTSHRWSRAAP